MNKLIRYIAESDQCYVYAVIILTVLAHMTTFLIWYNTEMTSAELQRYEQIIHCDTLRSRALKHGYEYRNYGVTTDDVNGDGKVDIERLDDGNVIWHEWIKIEGCSIWKISE